MTSLKKIISIVLIFLLIILINTNFVKSADLSLTNILNIFLIVIGILLILLAIAILIKLKN